ncbi:hypothetical protein NFJ02_14g16100 [Pycnococcus provasolii]
MAPLSRIREYWFGDGGGGGGASPIVRSARSAELQLEQWLDSEDGSALTPMMVVVPPAPAAEEKDKENDNDDDDDDDDDEHASEPLWANSHDAIAMVMSAMEAKDTRARELLEQLECVRHKLSVESQQRWAQLDELQKQRATEREVKASLDASKDENRRLREHVVEMRRSVQSALLAKSALQMRLEEAEQKQMRVLHDESERKKGHGLAAAASSHHHHHHRQVAPPPLPSQPQQTFSHPGNNNNTTSSSMTAAEAAMLEEEDEDEREGGGGGGGEEEASPSSPVKEVADEAAAAVTIRDRNVEATTTTSSRKSRKAKRHARSIALDDDK